MSPGASPRTRDPAERVVGGLATAGAPRQAAARCGAGVLLGAPPPGTAQTIQSLRVSQSQRTTSRESRQGTSLLESVAQRLALRCGPNVCVPPKTPMRKPSPRPPVLGGEQVVRARPSWVRLVSSQGHHGAPSWPVHAVRTRREDRRPGPRTWGPLQALHLPRATLGAATSRPAEQMCGGKDPSPTWPLRRSSGADALGLPPPAFVDAALPTRPTGAQTPAAPASPVSLGVTCLLLPTKQGVPNTPHAPHLTLSHHSRSSDLLLQLNHRGT